MALQAQRLQPEFILGMGDNFYPSKALVSVQGHSASFACKFVIGKITCAPHAAFTLWI